MGWCVILHSRLISCKKLIIKLKAKFQGTGIFARNSYLEVKSFQIKLALFAIQISNENFAHFPLLKSQSVNIASAQKYSQQITGLREEFA